MAKERTPSSGGLGMAAEINSPDHRVYNLASDLFARKVAMGACLRSTADSIAAACFEEARAFVAVAKAQDRLSSEV